jgi:hypothetical protein
MKNSINGPKDMHSASKPIGKTEKKTLVRSMYIWFGIIAALLCIPLFNFLLVPMVAVVGMGAYLLYMTGKFSNGDGSATEPDEKVSQDDHSNDAMPGLNYNHDRDQVRPARKSPPRSDSNLG